LAQNPILKQAAQNNDINVRDYTNPTSWRSNSKYHDFVATVATALDRETDVRNSHSEAVAAREAVEQKWAARLGISDEGLGEILSYLQSPEGSEQRMSGLPTVTGEGVRYQEDPLSKKADEITSEGSYDFGYTKLIARLAALLKYRQQIETGLEAQRNNTHAKVRRGLKDQLNSLNKRIDQYIKENEEILVHQFAFDVGVDEKTGTPLSNRVNMRQRIKTLEDVENHLAYNTEAHEELREAYLEELKWSDELSSVKQSIENLLGK